jgi:pyruvate kinase
MKTKIIATIGQASLEKNTMKQLIDSGIDVIRINTSYGDISQYENILKNLSEVDKSNKIKKLLDIKSEEILSFCDENKMDFIAVSFAESKEQILNIKNKLPDCVVISKIESVKGVENYEEILEVSDGVMIARGDLSRAVTLEKVPNLQKKFTRIALSKNKFVIAATEMLLSMTEKPYPTNAEVSDVANAVFDGVGAVMLSEETAVGKYPVEAVRVMEKIIEETEKSTEDSKL